MTDSLFDRMTQALVNGDLWHRPLLDRKTRRWITLTCAGDADMVQPIEDEVRAAYASGDIDDIEMQEFVLHFAVYSGWPKASCIEVTRRRVLKELAAEGIVIASHDAPPPLVTYGTAEDRLRQGADNFGIVMCKNPTQVDSVYKRAGIANFVFGEMWPRPALDRKTRRWITLAAVGDASTQQPIASHVYAALKSGDISDAEMQEFILHYSVYSGWHKGAAIEAARVAQLSVIAAEEAA